MPGFSAILTHILTCADCANDKDMNILISEYQVLLNDPSVFNYVIESVRREISNYSAEIHLSFEYA